MTPELSARQAALDALAEVAPRPTDLVEYVSRGRVAVMFPPERRAEAAIAAASANNPLLLSADKIKAVRGHLGAFAIVGDNSAEAADAVADLCSPPLAKQFNAELDTLPPGYFAAAADSQEEMNRTVAAAAEMEGVFHKPRYFAYDPSLCAHGASHIRGCERCLSACPAQAVESIGDKVQVDSNLCQGCGLCAMTCPGGAMRYAYPPPEDALRGLRAAVAAYRARSEAAPIVVFCAAEGAGAADIPADPLLIPVAMEEAGAAGMEMWLCALAYGAAAVAVLADHPKLESLAREQAAVANGITEALGFLRPIRIFTVGGDIRPESWPPPQLQPRIPAASFAPDNDKRTMLWMALNHLVASADAPPAEIALPSGAPLGEIAVNQDTCTLCMACAGACPASAVLAGGDSPRLLFVEENCLQCGLCEKACPESAIQLRPRLLTDSAARKWTRVVNEDKAVNCLQCGKPFASARIVGRIEEKLKAHWMFQSPAERRRLRLCEECRVRDMFDR